LRLLHPIMPYVTEEVWQQLVRSVGAPASGIDRDYAPAALMVARWPQEAGIEDSQGEADMALLMEIVRAIRNARAEHDVEPGRRIPAAIAGGASTDLLQEHATILCSLARLDEARLTITESQEPPDKAITLVVGSVAVFLPLAGLVDMGAQQSRLTKELEQTSNRIERALELLGNPGFTAKAPPEVVQSERDKLAELQAQSQELDSQLAGLEAEVL
jgi:valyl-tRNA synthetase